ncbi:MAG: lytic murein transglycosylase [Pseudorhodoplanes sp.]
MARAGNRGWVLLVSAALVLFALPAARAADPAFQAFQQSLWPDAQKLGVQRATFDAVTANLQPDLSLPELVIPGRAARPEPGQPEFVQKPADYLKESVLVRLAARGRKLYATHRAALQAIERQYGVPPDIVLAIWGRETAFGTAKLPYDATRVLATQAYLGRRKEQFRGEFLYLLKMLSDREAALADMRSSWAGAMGLTQFLPSEFYKYAVDFDGDGRRDIFRSVPDALASAARQLAEKGWQKGGAWAIEVHAPRDIDCTIAEPGHTRSIAAWLRDGFVPARGRKLRPADLVEEASLLMPEGIYGPAFLTPKNYFVLKSYNFSDLYVLFVGQLSELIGEGRPFEQRWANVRQMRTADLETIQRGLTESGFYKDKIDGKAGMKTRSALGAYQRANGLKVDCWPSPAVLKHMQKRR